MNRYPVWKYTVIAIVLLLGLIYALPNFFGEAPAVQVSAAKATVKVDTSTQARIEETLKAAGLAATRIVLEGTSVRASFGSTDEQLKAQDAGYTLTPEGEKTRVKFDMAIDLSIPMPGFLLKRTLKGGMETATDGLRKQVLKVKKG